MQACNWSNFEQELRNLETSIQVNLKVGQPFQVAALTNSSEVLKKAAEIFIVDRYPLSSMLGPILAREPHQKIRIGYFSADFFSHATAFLIAELFELHNKDQFEST